MDKNRKQKLDEIYREHAKSLYFYLYRLTGSPTTAEDLVQETFYKATVSLHFYLDHEIRGWLFKVARHAYLDEWRKRKRWEWVPFVESILEQEKILSPYEQPEEHLLEKEAVKDMSSLYGQLSETYRTILYLREEEEFSYQELGEALEMNENQVKVTLNRARKKFSSLAKKQYGDLEG